MNKHIPILHNKKALVTGATGAIGNEIVLSLVKNGATVVASGRNSERLDLLVNSNPEKIFKLECDLHDTERTEKLVSTAAEYMGGIDILVCNAGITIDKLSIMLKDSEWNEVININLNSSFILNRSAIKLMLKEKKCGRIVNVTSIIGHTGNPGQANYAASKAAITAMSKSMAKEVAHRNITINCIAPGFINSEMTAKIPEKQRDELLSMIPMKRLGIPSDIAPAVVFLCSDGAQYITGQTIHINGGMLMT